MILQERLASALDRLATGASVQRVRSNDVTRQVRNGTFTDEQEMRLESAVVKLENAADEIWKVLNLD